MRLVSDKFIEKLAKMGVMSTAKINNVKNLQTAKKTDGSKCRIFVNIPNL